MKGAIRLFSIDRVPVFFHWSVPIGLFVAGGFGLRPGGWLGWLVLVLGHELGHLAFINQYGLFAHRIGLHAFGGSVTYSPVPSKLRTAKIAWGGVMAQAIILVLALAVQEMGVLPNNQHINLFFFIVGPVNVALMLFNLLPIPPLDGATAWKLPKLVWLRRKAAALRHDLDVIQESQHEEPPRETESDHDEEDPYMWN